MRLSDIPDQFEDSDRILLRFLVNNAQSYIGNANVPKEIIDYSSASVQQVIDAINKQVYDSIYYVSNKPIRADDVQMPTNQIYNIPPNQFLYMRQGVARQPNELAKFLRNYLNQRILPIPKQD